MNDIESANRDSQINKFQDLFTTENLIKASRVALGALVIAVVPGGGIAAAIGGAVILVNRYRSSKKAEQPEDQELACAK